MAYSLIKKVIHLLMQNSLKLKNIHASFLKTHILSFRKQVELNLINEESKWFGKLKPKDADGISSTGCVCRTRPSCTQDNLGIS